MSQFSSGLLPFSSSAESIAFVTNASVFASVLLVMTFGDKFEYTKWKLDWPVGAEAEWGSEASSAVAAFSMWSFAALRTVMRSIWAPEERRISWARKGMRTWSEEELRRMP